jgi:hypothetical protein
MRIRGYQLTYPRLLLISLVLMTATASGFAVATSSASFGSYNPDWDGSRSLRLLADSEAEATIARSTDAYEQVNASDTTAIILSPQTPYSDVDAAQISSFVDNGGTVVVAGDFGGQTNRLLTAVGVESRIDGRLVRDERFYHRSSALPVANNISEPLADRVSDITLNHGSVVQADPNATVLATTSGYAYLDTNQNGTLDDSETLNEYPVVVSESVGEGSVVVVSDPSVFINAMLDREGNKAFATYLVSQSDQVVLDYSHTASPPLFATVLLILRDSWLLQGLLSVTLLAGIALVAESQGITSMLPGLHRDEGDTVTDLASTEAVVEAVAAEHPEWDEDDLRQVTQSIRTADHQQGDND